MNNCKFKMRVALMTGALLLNSFIAPLSQIQITYGDEKKNNPATTKQDSQSLLEKHKEYRIAALNKEWDAKVKESEKSANKAEDVFVQLKDAPAYKEAPTPTGTKDNVEEIKDVVDDVIADQKDVTKQAEAITGDDVQEQSGYLVNGFSIKASPKEVKELEAQNEVAAVYPVHTYQTADADALQLGNAVKAWDSEGVEHKGDGIVIADIDSGIDPTHRDFSYAPQKPALTEAKIKSLTTAKNLPGKYFSAKVPYGFNYASNNNVITDSGINHYHGMHVAGIMAADGTDYLKQKAYDDEMKNSGDKKKAEAAKKDAHITGNADVDGVAPHAQVLAMKVFGNNSTGARTPVIIRAIEDSVMLGADILNLSLGATCNGGPDDMEEAAMNNAAKMGALPVVAAGNSGNYASKWYGDDSQAKAIKEQETLGSPGTASDALTVASEDNIKKMVDSIKLVDENGKNIFSDISCEMNVTAAEAGFKWYDTSSNGFAVDKKYDFSEEGAATVDGKKPSFQMTMTDDGITEARQSIEENIKSIRSGVDQDGQPLKDTDMAIQMAMTALNINPAPDGYTKEMQKVHTIDDYENFYNKYYPKELPKGDLGRGYDVDFYAGFQLPDGSYSQELKDRKDKIAIMSESEFSQASRVNDARIHMLQGLIVVANDPKKQPGINSTNADIENDEGLPTIFISHADGEKLKNYFGTATGEIQKVQILRAPSRIDSSTAGKMSYFSSWGLTPTLGFKPEITAPGGDIWSTINNNQFTQMSGTSMATPFVAGSEALLLQDLKQTNLKGLDKVRAAKVRMQNSATPITETYTQNGKTVQAINSVRQQGAGGINVAKALVNKTLLSVHDKMEGALSLKQIKGTQSFKLDVTNTSSKTKTYQLNPNNGQFYSQTTAVGDDGKTDMLHEEPINKSLVSLSSGCLTNKFTVAPGQTKVLDMTLNVAKAEPQKQWLEGFFGIQEVGTDNTNVLPIVAYYGDLDQEKIVDPMAYEDDSYFNDSNLAPEENPFDGFGYSFDTAKDKFTFKPHDIWYSSNTNKEQNIGMMYLFHSIALTRNAKTLHGYLTDTKGKTLQEINKMDSIGRSYQSGSRLMDRLQPSEFAWSGEIVNPKNGERIQAPQGDYQYHLDATSYLSDTAKQSEVFDVHVDTTKPVIKNLRMEKRDDGFHVLGDVSDDRAGFNSGLHDNFISVNGHEFAIGRGEIAPMGRSKAFKLDYVLNESQNKQMLSGKNKIIFSLEDYAGNWIDDQFEYQNGDEDQAEFKIVTPAKPTKVVKDDDGEYSHVDLESNGDFTSDDPYGIADSDNTDPYSYMEYATNTTFSTDYNLSKSELDVVDHRVRVTGSSAHDFYVNGEKITPQKGQYDAWVPYNPKDLKVAELGHQVGHWTSLIYSNDAAGHDIVEKRPIKIYSTNHSAPIPVFADEKMHFDRNNDCSSTFDTERFALDGVFETNDYESRLKEMGLQDVKDFTAYYSLTVNKPDFAATYNIAKSSGDVHIINRTAGETDKDPDTIVHKQNEHNVVRQLNLHEGFNRIECYTDENPDAKETTVIYYRTKTMAKNALFVNNFSEMNLSDWDAKNKLYTLRGDAGENIKKITVLTNSMDQNDPKNQATLADNKWSIPIKLDDTFGYKQLTMLVTRSDGKTQQYTVGGAYDMCPPELKFCGSNLWKGNEKDGYDVYTNQCSYTFTGTAKDNADGMVMYVNGSHVLTDKGEGLKPGQDLSFKQTFNLEKNHMTKFEWKLIDAYGNTKFVTVRVHQGQS